MTWRLNHVHSLRGAAILYWNPIDHDQSDFLLTYKIWFPADATDAIRLPFETSFMLTKHHQILEYYLAIRRIDGKSH